MPGRPQRHKILEKFRKPQDRDLTLKELDALLEAAHEGVRRRLQRVAPEEATAARRALPLARAVFTGVVDRVGLEHAKQLATYIIADLSPQKIDEVGDALLRSPAALLLQEKLFLEALPPRSDLTKRKEYLARYELAPASIEQLALENDGSLAEEVLAKHNGMSRSKFQKIIAKASKQLRV